MSTACATLKSNLGPKVFLDITLYSQKTTAGFLTYQQSQKLGRDTELRRALINNRQVVSCRDKAGEENGNTKEKAKEL